MQHRFGLRPPGPLYIHPRPSWYTWGVVEAGHFFQEAYGVGAHIDQFNGVLGFPLHEIFERGSAESRFPETLRLFRSVVRLVWGV